MRRVAVLLVSLSVLLAAFPAASAAAPPGEGSWIVMLRPGVDATTVAPALAADHGGALGFVYRHALNGFSFGGSGAAASALARNPQVLAVEADGVASLDETQTNPTWGLDRIDQRTLPLDGAYTYDTSGAGVTAYVLDSGIRTAHAEFGGRASVGADFIGDGLNGQDCNGHGTHVAGTIGGATYGVAKSVDLVAVRIFGCSNSTSWSTVIAGMDWVIGDHQAGEPAVANMSLSGGAYWAVDTATGNLVNDGVSVAVAAGNSNVDACSASPARVPAALTSGATGGTDAKASYSNWGSCVDWFAPGSSILSAAISSNTASAYKSGTSMASPHTAGVAALYLEVNANASPAAVETALRDATTMGVVTSSSSPNNHLLYSRVTGGGGGGGVPAPTAAFTASTTSGTAPLTVLFTDQSVGSPASWAWSFGDGTGSTAQSPSHVYASAGTYDVTLTVTNGGGSDAETKTGYITVTNAPPSTAITLSVSGYKVKGVQRADLAWSGTAAANVDVYRDSVHFTTTANDGAYTDFIGKKGGGSYTYKVCEAGTSVCSNEVTVSY